MVAESVPVDKVDCLHCQHEYGLYSGLEDGFYGHLKRLGKPIVTTMHNTGNWDIDRIVASSSARVICHNKTCARRFGFPCEVIAHGCKPSETVSKEEAKRALGIPVEAPVVGYVGFISSYKGLEFLVEAMTGIPKAALLIAGGWHAGPDTEYIAQLKQRSLQVLAGRCQWLDFVPEDRLATVYGSMDLVVYPSLYISESGALLMALSHGKAVIARALPPVREKEKLGALTTFKAVPDLRRKIKLLLKSEEWIGELEKGAMDYAVQNSWQNVGALHMKLYEEMIKGGAG